MTSSPEPAASQTHAPDPAPAAEEHVVLRPPLEESIRAIEHVRQLLQEAVEHLDTGDDEQLVLAYEKSAESTDLVARALWFLHRVARDAQGAAGASGATGTAGASGASGAAGAPAGSAAH